MPFPLRFTADLLIATTWRARRRENAGPLISTRRWALFSRLLDSSSQSAAGASAPDQTTNLMIPGPQPDEFGEEAQAG